MTCQNLVFHRAHEEKQVFDSLLELLNLSTWMTCQSLIDTLYIDHGSFNQ
jgi:hypothetical protein